MPETASFTTASGIKIHALRTGWVDVKQAHRELNVPEFMAIPTIFWGSWANWMPIISYVVEHPDGIFLVDTGPSTDINTSDYYACDPHNGFFYKQNLRFFVPPSDTLLPRLAEIGIKPEQIQTVLITHFHADHIGSIDLLPNARFYTGEGNWPQHVGSLNCHLTSDFKPQTVLHQKQTVGKISQSMPLTEDGKIRIAPLPGHTPGHTGLAIVDDGTIWLMAGDSTFALNQTLRGGVTGVSQNLADARQTQALLRQQISDHKTILLPAHDPDAFERLRIPQFYTAD